MDTTQAVEIAVIGGGIAGLAAAVRLRERLGPRAAITVFDQAGRVGGKLRTDRFAGGYLEAGAETFLMRDPGGGPSPAAELARRVGLADAIRHPRTSQAALAVGGGLHPVPRATLMGVPADATVVRPVAEVDEGRDVDRGEPLLGPDEDVAVGALVRDRYGDEVVDRLVDPLLGGVYAGRADKLSLAVTVPALARTARVEHTLRDAVRAVMRPTAPVSAPPAAGAATPAPVFGTIEGGLGRLVEAVAAASGARLALGLPVRQLTRVGDRWRLVSGPVPDPSTMDFDAVVLAVPARPAARLLAGVDESAAAEVGVLDYANIALVRMAVPGAALPALSGLLVPATEGYAVKALTIFSTKWAHLNRPDGTALLRASIGRYGDTAALQRPDDELIALARDELGRLLGTGLPEPVAADVVRWGGGLPQYGPGHLGRVAAVRAALAGYPTLALAGAAYDGVGIPACVRSGQAAADRLLETVAPGLDSGHD